jgi:aspartate aminotransferase-like enzyme
MKALGLELFAERPADGLTVAKMPPGIDSSAVVEKLDKQYGLRIANGQDTLKGKIIRVAHMGYSDPFDVLAAISGIELVLLELGAEVKPGSGVAAAQQVLAEGVKRV